LSGPLVSVDVVAFSEHVAPVSLLLAFPQMKDALGCPFGTVEDSVYFGALGGA